MLIARWVKLEVEAGIDEFSASARMNQYEKWKHTPDFEISKKLAEILNVSTSYFYEDDVLAKMALPDFAE